MDLQSLPKRVEKTQLIMTAGYLLLSPKRLDIVLRSGRRPNRWSLQCLTGLWLSWQTLGGELVAAAIVQRHGPPKGACCCSLEYIAASPKGKAHLLVVASEEICRSQGCSFLYSAADLSQCGDAWDGKAKSARAVHETWGFSDVSPEEWHEMGLTEYSADSEVHFTKKRVQPL